jgi:hypothetical protein
MQAGINRDLPACTSLSKLVGSNHPLFHCEGSWQQGSSEQWHHGNFDNYQQQHYEEVSSGHQGGRMSFSARGYHDQQMDHSCLDTRLTTREEAQHDFTTPCTSALSGKQTWEMLSPTSSKTSNKRMGTRTICSRGSTSTRHSERLQQHPAWGRRIPHLSKVSFLF